MVILVVAALLLAALFVAAVLGLVGSWPTTENRLDRASSDARAEVDAATRSFVEATRRTLGGR